MCSTADSQKASTSPQSSVVSAANNPQTTPPTTSQQEQPINGALKTVTGNAQSLQETPKE